MVPAAAMPGKGNVLNPEFAGSASDSCGPMQYVPHARFRLDLRSMKDASLLRPEPGPWAARHLQARRRDVSIRIGVLSASDCGISFSTPCVAWLLAPRKTTRTPSSDLTNLGHLISDVFRRGFEHARRRCRRWAPRLGKVFSPAPTDLLADR
jgi:hypothetical protein